MYRGVGRKGETRRGWVKETVKRVRGMEGQAEKGDWGRRKKGFEDSRDEESSGWVVE